MNFRYFSYSLLAWLVIIDACRNPLDGVTLGLKDPIQDGLVECHFYDPAGNPLPAVNQVKIAGPDASQVVTTVNTTHYKINSDGILLVAASPQAIVSPETPLRFSIVAEAPNYLTVIQPIILTGKERQIRSIRWINLLKPPRTLAAARTSGRASADGLVTSTFTTTTTQLTADADHSTVVVPSGTKLTDRDGQVVAGDLTLAVIHTNARSDSSTSYIPGGGVMSNVASRNGGASLGTLRILSIAGSVTMQLYTNQYALATNLSQAISWTMDLNPATYNTGRGRVIQEGDSIPLFRYDDVTARWQEEVSGVVARNQQTNRLEYRASTRFIAAYVVGWTESICDAGPVFKVVSKLADVDINYLCKLVDVATNLDMLSFYANVNNGSVIQIRNQPRNRRLKLQVYDQTDAGGKGTSGRLIAESVPGLTCDLTPIEINLSPLPIPAATSLALEYVCPSGTTLNQSLIPALVKVQYSEVGKKNWRDLVTITRTQRSATSYKLEVGHSYDFRVSTDGGASWPFEQDNYLVDKSDLTLTIQLAIYCQ